MPNPGDLLMSRYRILERLGSGGMATVHRARDERLDRDVAIKVLLPNLAGDPLTAARFAREARALAAAAHPGVVAVFDVEAGDAWTGREPFFVMELCSGGSLADRLSGGARLDPGDVIPILVAIADGLAELHRRGMVHRDVKPQNILLGADRAKLADFGLALADDATGMSELTTPGTAVGTLAYLAPEILAGERASFPADVYGLGVVTFLALTGELPRSAASMADLVAASRMPPGRISSVAPDLGPAFDDIVAGALETRPDDRPDALAFASGLTGALGRWSRDGGPARRSAVGHASEESVAPGVLVTPSMTAVGRAPGGEQEVVDDATTDVAVPLGATVAAPIPGPAAVAPPRVTRTDRSRPVSWLVPVGVIALLVLAAMAIVAALGAGQPALPGVIASSPARSASPIAPSAVASALPVSPSPSVDAANDALNAMDAAIAAARGGSDGLKGKDANDLEARVADIRQRLDEGDRRAALEEARKLDRRVEDLAKNLSPDNAARLRTASQDLVRALGG